MKTREVRQRYLTFFQERGHAVLPSAPLVPENDPTTLFVSSGMQPLLQYFLGEEHPEGSRLTDSQKCFRAEDIEEVGDNRHTTFFEMLGNWSLGDYFKEEQLAWFFEFLTNELGIAPERLYVTTFGGDEENGLPKDTESVAIWQRLFQEKGIAAEAADMDTMDKAAGRGMHEGERIFYYGAKKNWWSRAGEPAKMPAGEPGGPDSEVFYDFGTEHDPAFGENCHPNCDCGRLVEIGNSVFMQYLKQDDGSFSQLPKKNVDFGGGLERIAAATENNPDIFAAVETLARPVEELERATGASYASPEHREAFRVVADHIRAAVFIAADGTEPSNKERGYILRRLIRRSVFTLYQRGVYDSNWVAPVVDALSEGYSDAYPEIFQKRDALVRTIQDEVVRFHETLERGTREFEKRTKGEGGLTTEDVFDLYQTYGFPFELVQEMAENKGIDVDEQAFSERLTEHREKSRAGAEQKFKGGLADTTEMSVKYHTATHLLHQALRDVLGEHVHQKGSNITPERLRFDLNFERKMTDEEKKQVEDIVNEKIAAALPVHYEDISKEEAERRGAIGLFDDHYGDVVRVHQIGDAEHGGIYSLEYCGGPHVANTADLAGTFTIKKEEAVSQGVRRIKAVLE